MDKRYSRPVGTGLRAMAIACLAIALPLQADESQSQAHQLRASIAMAHSISPETAKRYGIDQGPRQALVDVVVMRTGGSTETVPALVEVRANNLAGQTLHVKMRPTSEAGRVSYLGVYTFTPDEVVDFDVVARPENSTEVLRAHVREHFPAD